MHHDRTDVTEVSEGRDALSQPPDRAIPTDSAVETADDSPATNGEPPLRVMALHALLYCERLFYLEEVEEIRVADAAVYAGRRLHDDLAPLDDESPEHRRVEVSSERLGLMGVIDAVRRRDGVWVAYEHKRGRCQRGENKAVLPWPSDRIQAIAYALLLEEVLGEPVPQARIRYHAENVTATVPIDAAARADLDAAIARARELRKSIDRPPVHPNERMCVRCSLAVVCLPEEERLAEKKERQKGQARRAPPGPPVLRGEDGAGAEALPHATPKNAFANPHPNPPRERGGGRLPPVRGGIEGGQGLASARAEYSPDDMQAPAEATHPGLPLQRGGDGAGEPRAAVSVADGYAAIRDVFAEAETKTSAPTPKCEPGVPTLFPSHRERQTLHVVSPRAYVSRSGETLVVEIEDEKQKVPIADIDSLVIHGFGQVTTQAIHLCAKRGVAVQWLTAGGRFSAGTSASPGRVQQRLRQYAALSQQEVRLQLTRRLVHAKVETQLRYLLRATRGDASSRAVCRAPIERIREALRKIPQALSADSMRGLEGIAAKSYFACLPHLIGLQAGEALRPVGRSKHPPQDRFNCLLSFGYALIQSLTQRSILAVGLEPALGFFHQPRTAAAPLVLDVMELFRTPLWEIPLVGSVNRGQWDADADFDVRPGQVWLTAAGRKKALQLFEQRLQESYKHPYTRQSLCYARMVELEVRLLEKEWTGCPGLFAKMRIR